MLDCLFLAQAVTEKAAEAVAQVATQPGVDMNQSLKAAISIGITAAVLILPFVLGIVLSRFFRMPGYGGKIGWCLAAVAISIAIIFAYYPPKLGVDLSGGTVLVYQIDKQATADMRAATGRAFDMEALCQALTMRVNPDGLKEIVIRPFGEDQVEVIIPETDLVEVSRIKSVLNQPGFLNFRIVANPQEDSALIARATEQERDPEQRMSRYVFSGTDKDAEGKPKQIGYWAHLMREYVNGKPARYKWREGLRFITRNGNTGEFIPNDQLQQIQILAGEDTGTRLEDYLAEQKILPEVLMRVDEEYSVGGDDLGPTEKSFGIDGWQINFTIKQGEASTRMGQMTGRNLRGEGREPRYMAILLDGDVISAPAIRGRISDRGQITGRFTEEEVTFVVEVLRAGQLPAVLDKNPASENQIKATLGQDTIQKGAYSAAISLVVIMIFMLVYYRFAGVVANVALLLNIAMTIALMMLFKAPLTLPGLAGIVLTVGMAVDSNVLIFERMREELQKGAALRMALRNGFDRALVTIIDSNLTTLFTAVVLYLRGTDQVRGFATTLTLGICTSMFTACFVARVIFDIAERNHWIRSLSMMKMMTTTNIKFTKMMVPAMVASLVFMAIGASALVVRGSSLFDIDLVGGTKVIWQFTESMSPDVVRAKLNAGFEGVKDETGGAATYALTPVALKNAKEDTGYDLVCSLQDEVKLKDVIVKTFTEDGKSLLPVYEMDIVALATTTATRPVDPATGSGARPSTPELTAPAETPATPAESPATPEKTPEGTPAATTPPAEATPAETPPASEEQTKKSACQAPEDEPEAAAKKDEPEATKKEDPAVPAADAPGAEANPKPAAEETPATPENEAAPEVPSDLKQPATGERVVSILTEAKLKFPASAITADALVDRFRLCAFDLYGEEPQVVAEGTEAADQKRDEWTIKVSMNEEKTRKVLEKIQADMRGTPVFESSTKIGGQVAGDSQRNAIYAILISLVMIMAYIWLRFHKLSWGIAAVAALVHDSLIMLGAVALSAWLAPAFGFLMVEEFRISLTVIAAFLTLIGFSINDTIVIFDRIREIRGKNPELTAQMIDDAVNQTLSRTILTSGTVFLVLVVLYVGGGPGVHAFAFSLLVGVISGTYSTVFIAAPLLLWMLGKKGKNGMFSA